MDGRTVCKIFTQIEAQFFLYASPDPNDHLCGLANLENRNQLIVGDVTSVNWRDVSVGCGDFIAFSAKESQGFYPRHLAWQYQEEAPGFTKFFFIQKNPQILET